MVPGLRVGFAGTPEFARAALAALIDAGYDIPVVLTQPDRPAGRGMKLTASPVKQLALEHGLPVWQPPTLKTADIQEQLRALGLDVLVVAAYGLLLPQVVLDIPRLGCINLHASLLPRWRGAAPIHRAIEAGDAETGITVMQMEAGLDTGPMLSTHRCPIAPDDTTGRLHDKLAALGAEAIVDALPKLAAGQLTPVMQPEEGVTYAHKIDKAEAQLDWTQSAEVLARRIRAFDPFPGAVTSLSNEPVKIWAATVTDGAGEPGTVLSVDRDQLVVACGSGALAVSEVQRAGGKRQPVSAFLAGMPLNVGDRFERPTA